ncbi:antibiotic biosynthesis monooxygenase [Belnapia moabensis]|uniref:antibiotic biosynthesis monooxygenase n=1 Tax=Belnapia moabensis TaxID=365533 RepID=UPI0005B9D31C|nr:antibiotic biosynthesis monooxygenase [Belnapia moabensis]
MHIMISRYAGAAGMTAEAAPKAQHGLVPILKDQPGFYGYAAFGSEQGDIVSVSVWESGTAAAEARPKIGEWVSGNLAGLSQPTERFLGDVGPHAMATPQSGGSAQSLYCMVRKAENLPSTAIQQPVVEEMLATTQKVPGFRGAYWLRSADDQTRGASVLFFDNREHAWEAHETALAVMNKHQPNVSVRVAASGQTAVLAMA